MLEVESHNGQSKYTGSIGDKRQSDVKQNTENSIH